MDVAEYLPMFLAESREHLQELNLAIVKLEEHPDDRETVDEVFRIAHSLKGMSATMGFAAVAALTHEMENVLELLRQRRSALGRDVVDALLACLDALGEGVDEIEASGEDTLEAAPLIARLRALVRAESEDAPAAEHAAAPAAPVEGTQIVVTLAENASMPAVRALQVLQAAGAAASVVHSVPAEADLEDFSGTTVEVWVAGEAAPAGLLDALRAITDVAEATVGVPAQAAEQAEARTPQRASTVRIDAARLDQLMHLMGELVVHRTRLESLVTDAHSADLSHAMQDVTRSSQALQAMVMQVRMIPVEAVFVRFPRLIRDLSAKLGKQVELVLHGRDTELDRTVVEALGDPLVHLVRNALDHGLEPPDERTAAGKPATGTLEISARHAGGNVVISVRDDGRGIDPARVARKAVESGLIAPDAVDTVDVQRAVELLFTPGFSTAEEMSDLSGRGVGMDAVRSMIRALGGDVVVTSEHGSGTTAQIRLPLTLAIMAALLVRAGDLPFGIPLDRIERTLKLDEYPVRSVAGRRMLVVADAALPLIDLAEALGYPSGGGDHAVIVHAGDRRIALAIQRLVGQHELVTRPLPSEVTHRAALSGGAVLSNGDIALIVDCDALAQTGRGLLAPAALAA